MQRLSDRFGLRPPLLAELPLRGRLVVGIAHRIRIRNVRIGGAVAKHDDVSADPEVVEPIRLCRPVQDEQRNKHGE
jgi:hypothetical protein